jgi:hypothetical protein
VNAPKEKLCVPESFVETLPPLFKEAARILEERGKIAIEKESG